MESFGEKSKLVHYEDSAMTTRFKVEGNRVILYPFFMARLESLVRSQSWLSLPQQLPNIGQTGLSRKRNIKAIWLKPLSKGEILKREQRNAEFVCEGKVNFHSVFRKKICLLGILPNFNLNNRYFYIWKASKVLAYKMMLWRQ